MPGYPCLRRLLPVLLLVPAFLSFQVTTFGDDWQEVRNVDGVVVKQRSVAGSGYKETHGVMRTNAGMFAVLAVLKDSAACTQWLYKCKHGETIAELSAAEHIYYTVIDAPFMLRDRDMYVRSKVTYSVARSRLDIIMQGVSTYAPKHRRKVRVLDLRGFWIVQKIDDGQLEMTYQVHSNPQVSPKAPVNSMMIDSVFETLQRVARLAASSKYAAVSFSAAELDAIAASK